MLRYISDFLLCFIALSLNFCLVPQLLQLPFTEQLLRPGHCAKLFTYSISFTNHNDAINGILIPSLLDVETEAIGN